ncbi:MAG TPA: stage II sporulation protein M [Methanocella sp.]|uniref:stage II sporulation protein M n=1 Tax=Methanocella sp. TaxID=2052833 RepID=UPI002CE62E87|nr:stage II sporulation protein M [Methanocella sp.]HTY91745.1 stage II sporulation protein M [Methanocella sp.]
MADLRPRIPGPSSFVKYVSDSRTFIGIVVVLFLVSTAAGYALPGTAPYMAQSLLSGLQDKASQLTGQPPLIMVLGIFANNTAGALVDMIFGLAAGVFPLFFIVSNGMVIGIVLEMMVAKLGAGMGVLVFIAGILPHGIFELPAIILATAIGLKLGFHAIQSLLKMQDLVTGELVNALLIFLFWIVPMLFIAAVIETFVTGALVGYMV